MKSENINRYNSTDFRRIAFPMTQIFSWKKTDNDFYEENLAGGIERIKRHLSIQHFQKPVTHVIIKCAIGIVSSFCVIERQES